MTDGAPGVIHPNRTQGLKIPEGSFVAPLDSNPSSEFNIPLSEISPEQNPGMFADVRERAVSRRSDQERCGSFYRKDLKQADFFLETNSASVKSVELVLFSSEDAVRPSVTFPMKSTAPGRFELGLSGRTVRPGLLYGFKLEYSEGRHCPSPWIVDPYARALVPPQWLRNKPLEENIEPDGDAFLPPKAFLMDVDKYHQVPVPSFPPEKRIFYEMHIQDTKTFPNYLIPQSQEHFKNTQGTFFFLRCPAFLEHLKALNITTIELMPTHLGMDEWTLVGQVKNNVWGYNPVNFFAIEPACCQFHDPHDQIREIQDTVSMLHEKGFEIIADFVTGHTSERGKDSPTYHGAYGREYEKGATTSLRAIDDDAYYAKNERGEYLDATGCQNTVRSDTPQAQQLLLAARDWWLDTLGFDGLRVDQASILGRNGKIEFNKDAQFLKEFPRKGKLLVAEPCDGRGSFQGEFPFPWIEWNFNHRTANRDFFSGRLSKVSVMAPRFCGNTDTYRRDRVNRGVNFASCHDGHTVWDMTAEMLEELEKKGAFQPPPQMGAIDRRIALCRAMHASVIFAPGPFMISRGEEVLRTQDGNHNAYNELKYKGVEWIPGKTRSIDHPAPARKKAEFKAWMEDAVTLRKNLKVFDSTQFYKAGPVRWYGADGASIEAETRRRFSGTGSLCEKLGEAWGRQNNFLGVLYSGGQFSPDKSVPPVYVARAGAGIHYFSLPHINGAHGWKWRLVMDSREGYFFRGETLAPRGVRKPAEGIREDLLHSGQLYWLGMPAVVVFQLVRDVPL